MRALILSAVLLLAAAANVAQSLTFTLNPEANPSYVVSDNFLSVALDCSNIEGRFSDFDLTDPYLTKLVNHLAPMYFRIGGTYADRLVFSESEDSKGAGESDLTFYASDYLKLYQFTQNAKVDLIYDLNSLLRNADGTWNSENAELMVQFSNEHNMKLDWELGNEPDLYSSIYKTQVDATQLAKDVAKLRTILNKYDLYKSSYIVGNDMFDVGGSQNNQNYLSAYLEGGAAQVVHAVTWHHYYFAGRDATEDLFLSPSVMNYLEQRTDVVKNVVGKSGSGNKIWLGETSSAYNGGAANMSNRFIGTFLWLDKLGLGANLGLDVIIRQTIFHDNYALIDNSYTPNPDWWVSVLYKQLVGNSVLAFGNDGTADNKVRLYAHCAKNGRSGVVVFGFNVDKQSATVSVSGIQSQTVYSYELTSADGSLYSQNVNLNGQVLSVSQNGDLPELTPKEIKNDGTLTLAPYSINFWVFNDSNVKACAT